MKENPKDIQYLKDSGWNLHENGWGWLREGMNPNYGGYTLTEAIKIQKEIEIIQKNGRFYFYVHDNYGYGYRIRYYNNILQEHISNTEFDHLTKEAAEKFVNLFNNGISLNHYVPNFSKNKFNIIIKFSEKYGDRYFYVPTCSDLEKVALKIVTERNETDGYHFDWIEKEPEVPKLTVDDAKKFGMNGVLKSTEQEWNNYKSIVKQYKLNQRLKQALIDIIKNQDGKLALEFLSSMRKNEYEGYEIIKTEDYESLSQKNS